MERLVVNIDLETIPPGDLETFELTKSPPKTIKDPKKIEAWKLENREKAFRDQAKEPRTAQILVAGLTIEDESSLDNDDFEPAPITIFSETEEKIIVRLEQMLKERLIETFEEGEEERETEMRSILWVGYNIRKFDLEALWVKAMKYRCFFLARLIPRNRYDKSVYDLMEIVQGPRSMDFVSYDTTMQMFGLGAKTDGMDGSKVYDQYLAGNLKDVIVPYCIDDIMGNRRLFKLLRRGVLQ